MRTHIGIDPGAKGGIAILGDDGELLELYRMPKHPVNIKEILHSARNNYPLPKVTIEKSQAMPKQGVCSMYSYGLHNGILIGICEGLDLPYELVRPQIWKKAVIPEGEDRKDKDVSIRVAENLFPAIDLVPYRCRVPQDGMAEAALIAHYAWKCCS